MEKHNATKIPLVLLPGLDGTGVLFAPFLAQLPTQFETHVIHYPNACLSPRELAELVLQQVEFTPDTVLIAESFSGLVAIELVKRQIVLKALIFCASFGKSPRPQLLNTLKHLPLAQLLRLPIPYQALSRLGMNTQTQYLLSQAMQQVDNSVLAYRFRCLANAPVINLTQTYNIPTFYWRAANDWAVPLSNANALKVYFPHLQIHTIADSGHFLLQTQPAKCVKQLIQALTPI